jgi:acyl-CoA synthetase (AMP-forming)/AMP-acid ligase II
LFPLDRVEVRIGRDDRIEVRGPSVFAGYVAAPDRHISDWFITADRGHLEPDGSLVVTGRWDRRIVSGGEKVDPVVIEAAVTAHPEVLETHVMGLPDEEWGEIVAVVYTGTATPPDLRVFIADRLPPHAMPKRWLQAEEIPRTEMGKVDGAALRTRFES